MTKSTRGFSGAEIRNVCNIAALNAVTERHKKVSNADFEVAIDKIKRKSSRLKERLNRDQAKWERVATQKLGEAGIDTLLGINSIHKLELLDVQNHFKMNEAGSFKGIELLANEKSRSLLEPSEFKFVQGWAIVFTLSSAFCNAKSPNYRPGFETAGLLGLVVAH